MRKPRASKARPTEQIQPVSAELRDRLLAQEEDWYGFRMILIGNLYSGPLFADLAGSFGLLRDEFVILAILSDYGAMSANMICGMSGRPKNSISRAVIKLTAGGMISASPSERDRRAVNLAVSDRGKELYEQVLGRVRVREQEMFGCLSSHEMADLDHLLAKVLEHWHRRR